MAYGATAQAEVGFTRNTLRQFGADGADRGSDALTHGDLYAGLCGAIAALRWALSTCLLQTQAPALTCPCLPLAVTHATPSGGGGGGGGGGAKRSTHTPTLLRTCPFTQTSAPLTAGDAMVTTATGAATAIIVPAAAAHVRIQ
jgi:hypothetical protein